MFYQEEHTGVFIDGSNMHRTMQALGWEMDYTRLHQYLAGKCRLMRAHYYTAVSDNPSEYSNVRPFVDYLNANGYKVVSKPIKEINDHESGRMVRKGNMDIEIAIDMVLLAPYLDHLILFSGDGDFCRAVDALQSLGKRVTVACTVKSKDKVTAEALRRIADDFLELADLQPFVGRNQATRNIKSVKARAEALASV